MKTLYIVRHAKALKSKKYRDWQRPLTLAGIERATRVAHILKRKKVNCDRILSSHAFRALNTAIIFATHLGYPIKDIEIEEKVYDAPCQRFLELIRKQNPEYSSLMLVGHNPGLNNLYKMLSGDNKTQLVTSAVACLKFEVQDWQAISARKGEVIFLETGN